MNSSLVRFVTFKKESFFFSVVFFDIERNETQFNI